MTMLKLAKNATALFLFGAVFAGSGFAAPTLLGSSVQGSGNTADLYAGNYNGTVPTGASFDGTPLIAGGNAPSQYQTPFNYTPLSATQSFFSVGGPQDPSPTTLTFSSPQNSFSILWGSIDSYNTISFSNGSIWTGTDIINLFTLGGSAASFERVAELRFDFDAAKSFNTVTFTSTQAAFEFALPSQVPEPGTLALLGLALGVAGVVSRRRKA